MDAAPEVDKNTRGLGVVLRFAGAFLPLVVFFVLFLWVESPQDGAGSGAALSGAFKVISFLWAWPYAMWDQQPFSFGACVLLLLVFVVVLFARRDWKGATALLVIVSLCSWLVAAIIGQAQGT